MAVAENKLGEKPETDMTAAPQEGKEATPSPEGDPEISYPFAWPGVAGGGLGLTKEQEELFFLCGLSLDASTSPWYPRIKRAVDIAVSAGMLILLSPLFLLIALAIWLEDRGPIFYRQTRIGQDRRPFTFYKFRSMVVNADEIKHHLAQQNEQNGPVFKIRNDPRVTRVGRLLRKTSLDELPQFYNVLRGDMSLVGPRPHLPHEVDKYLLHHELRLTVPPGLVCLREVCGRSDLPFERWIELDLMYIRRRSLKTDFCILKRAVRAVLRGEGAY
ncbi:MAG: sugar transferase [Armatimonadota bacterium]|jgi:lipopolysaccharide/colanic/teichoic acid biosynthesis glycosyltransferase